MPSGAASTQTTMIVPVAPRSSSSWQVCASDPPVASIGSSTMHCRPARFSGSLLTYGLGWNVSSSRRHADEPDVGVRAAAPARRARSRARRAAPARRPAATAMRRPASSVTAASSTRTVVRRQAAGRLGDQQRADALQLLAEQRVRACPCRGPGSSESAISGWSTRWTATVMTASVSDSSAQGFSSTADGRRRREPARSAA